MHDVPNTSCRLIDSAPPDARPRRTAGRANGRADGRADGRATGRRGERFAAIGLGLAVALVPLAAARAAGEVSGVRTVERSGTPFRYEAGGTAYRWGEGANTQLEGFTSEGRDYGYALTADRVELRRDDVADTAGGNPCGVFVERLDASSAVLAADYPRGAADADADGRLCDMAALLRSRTVNRGTLDLFSNRSPDAKHVERVDYLFDSGILAPVTPEGLGRAGHLVAEKGGNNRLKIAAVLSLDAFGQPASYGAQVLVREAGCGSDELCYGVTDLVHHYAFFHTAPGAPQGYPVAGRQSTEAVAMAFVSGERLGLHAGQRYFGFSLFADDVDTDDHDLLDPSSFPDDTQDSHVADGDSADVYGGLSGWFIDETLSNGSGRVFLDENGDSLPNEGEAGIADIQIQLYRDTDGDGLFDPARDEPVCNATDTDTHGRFVLPGLPDGDYFAVVRENDPELPSGLELVGVNPRPFTIAGLDDDTLDFAFTDPDGGAGGDAGDDAGDDGGAADGDGTDTGTGGGTGSDAGGDGGATDGDGTDTGTGGGTGSDAGDDGGATDGDGTDTGTGGDTGSDAGGDSGATDGDGTDTGTGGDTGSDAGDDGGATSGDGPDTGTDTGTGGDTGSDAGTPDDGTDTGTGAGGEPDPGANLDDPVTVARRDVFDVRQDVGTPLDVLANDSDAAGEGLSIIRVADTQNATIVIETDGGGLLYTPDAGYSGPDSFVYEIRDGEGEEASGTVTVNVLPFSDVNGNRVDDYAECDCTDLTLETGIHGSGVGRPSLALLALLASALLVRFGRHPRRPDPAGARR